MFVSVLSNKHFSFNPSLRRRTQNLPLFSAELKALEHKLPEGNVILFFFLRAAVNLDILFGLAKMLPAHFYSFHSLWTFIGPLVELFLFDI